MIGLIKLKEQNLTKQREMKYRSINIILLLIVALCIGSCSKEEVDTESNLGIYTDYYPLSIGNYHTYLVDSIYYNDFTGKSDTFQFQLKELIADTFYDESNLLNYRLERFHKFKDTSNTSFSTIAWSFTDVWFITKTETTIQRVEENIRISSLTNPIKNGTSWDGNAFNILEKRNFTYSNFGETINEYPNSIKVIQSDVENLIQKIRFEQDFAKNIGITRYYYMKVESQNISDPNVPITERIEKGVQYEQVLIDYYVQ